MTDDLEKLSSLSQEEKAKLLQWYREQPDSEAELDALTQTPGRSGKKRWNDVPELVEAVHALLLSIMGPDSPYQFAGLQPLYNAYRALQDKHAPFAIYLGREYFQFFVRKWIIQHAPLWEEKSQGRRNKVRFQFPNGYISGQWSGFGKKRLEWLEDGEMFYAYKMIPLATVWQSQIYYENQPGRAELKP